MIFSVNNNSKIVLPVNDREEENEPHSSTFSKESLSLVYFKENGYHSFAITCPSLLPSNCLNNKLVVLPDVLISAFTDDQTFAPLVLSFRQHFMNKPEPDELTLLCYFYLNPVPSSVSFITRWFTDAGTAPERASVLAKLVYIARTDKDDKEVGFIEDYKRTHNHESVTSENGKSILFPQSLSEAFNPLLVSDGSLLTYDCLSQNHPGNGESATIIRLDRLSETGFLIEDHALLIVGLSVSITELARLTEHRWPLFYKGLLTEIPLYLRDFYSLGRMIFEKPDIIQRLQSDFNITMDVISFSPDGTKPSSNILSPGLLTASKDRPEIPAFLRILK